MIRRVVRAASAAACLFLINPTGAFAHVKWFLGADESEILKQAKPEMFTTLSIWNTVALVVTFVVLLLLTKLARKFDNSKLSRRLFQFAERMEPFVNLLIGLCTGGLLISCALTRHLIAPNFVICEHCPQWLPYVEATIGFSLAAGLFTRVGAIGLLWLLAFTFSKHGVLDCLDLVPIYGLAIYFVIAGRGLYSFDHALLIQKAVSQNLANLAHLMLRWFIGMGLVILALDEKLLHPQLSMALLKHAPSLNVFAQFGFSNEMFVLCTGLAELCIGLMFLFGLLPRLAGIVLAAVFVSTTITFGNVELIGHLPYYGILLSVLLRGIGLPAWDRQTVAYPNQSRAFAGTSS